VRVTCVRLSMAYIVVKTIKGRQYRYQQRTYRQGGKVRTETIYLGPVGGGIRRKGVLRSVGDFIRANMTPRHGLPDEETMLKQYNEKVAREQQARDKLIADLHAKFGLKMGDPNPVPIAAPQPEVSQEDAPSEAKDGAEAQ
jgi:hypothetical protein